MRCSKRDVRVILALPLEAGILACRTKHFCLHLSGKLFWREDVAAGERNDDSNEEEELVKCNPDGVIVDDRMSLLYQHLTQTAIFNSL